MSFSPPWICRPAYKGLALASVVPGAALTLGMTADDGDPDVGVELASVAAELRGGGREPHGICLVLADGLGSRQLAARVGHAPFLRTLAESTLRVGCPSTTSASLGSFGTGAWPGETGLVGYSVRDPATGQKTSLIGWETATPAGEWQRVPTLFSRLSAVGEQVSYVGQRSFEGSALTLAAFRGTRFIVADGPVRMVAAARSATQDSRITYVYWGNLDKVGHREGWGSRRWCTALELFDRTMLDLRRALPPGVEMWITADHGMVDTAEGPQWDVAEIPALAEGISMVAGEPRALHLYCDDPFAVADRWRSVLAEHAWVLTKEEAIAEGLFGPTVAPHVRPILGDVFVLCSGTALVVDSRTATPASLRMMAHHGSLTADEVEVPLLVAPSDTP
ncbi:MAG: alkaline phosphatase family protein [Micrococcales bacterium]|nr:alkaline phosphatase family protein [Micrococcales bacterium]